MAVSISLTGQMVVSDGVLGTTSLQKQLSVIMPGFAFSEAQYLSIGTASTSISLPISPVQFVYIKNLHTVNVITVTWTPNAGASNPVIALQPGSLIILSEALNTPSSGITALSLQANLPNTPVEFLLGG